MNELPDFFSRKHFTTILNYVAIKSTSTFQEGRLGWTLTRPSYRLIGTHRLTRSVLEWRSVSSSSLLSSIIKPDPCIHWSQMVNTELLHWAVTRGRSSLGLGPLCNPIATKKDSTFYAPIATTLKRELVSFLTIKMSVIAATPESGLALEGFSMTPTRVVTKLLMVEIMATSTSKRWDTSWSNKRPSNPTNKLLIVVENRFKSYTIKGFVKMRWNKILYRKGFSLSFWLKKYRLRPKTNRLEPQPVPRLIPLENVFREQGRIFMFSKAPSSLGQKVSKFRTKKCAFQASSQIKLTLSRYWARNEVL